MNKVSPVSGGKTLTIVPPLGEWHQRLTVNQQRPSQTLLGLTPAEQAELRRELVQLGWHTAQSLLALGRDAGLPEDRWRNGLPSHAPAAEQAIITTGHQPVVFHPGLLEKYQQTAAFAERVGAVALAMTMDTDHGDAGRFLCPSRSASEAAQISDGLPASTVARSLATPSGLFAHATLLAHNQLVAVREQTLADLTACQCQPAQRSFHAVMDTYLRLAGRPAGEAHALTRAFHGATRGLLEVRLSDVCRVPAFVKAQVHLVAQAERFTECYQQTLHAWRRQRGIRNRVNPFPDLAVTDGARELPFWVLDMASGRRSALWARIAGGRVTLWADQLSLGSIDADSVAWPHESQPYLISPRGAVITVLFRLLCGDLFVHGLGGQIYDAYTDELVRAYWGFDAPEFVVASATQYLFPTGAAQLEQAERMTTQERVWSHHPKTLLGQQLVSPAAEIQLKSLIDDKRALLRELQINKQQGISAVKQTKQLQALQDRVREVIRDDLSHRQPRLGDAPDAARDAICCRTYPWFFWPDTTESA